MSLTFGLNPWLLLLCLCGAGLLTWWTYRLTTPPLPTGRRALLGALRFLALFLILFLLFEPILRRTETQQFPPLLGVLIDDSQSLRPLGDSTVTARPDFSEALAALTGLSLAGEQPRYAFGQNVTPLSNPDSLGFDAERTNISQALDYVREAHQNDNLSGVLLLSDGQYNTGRNPLYLAERYPVPIYTVTLGDTTQQRDLQIQRVTTNELAYVGAELPVQVGLRADGYAGERVAVRLVRNGTVLDSQTATLPAGTAEVPVDLAYTPTEEGLDRLRLSVTRLDGEATYRNNIEAVTVRVLRSKKRILLFASAPSPDVAALRQVLSVDPNVELASFIQKRPGAFYEGRAPDTFDNFDLLVLAGYPGRGASRAILEQIAVAADAGKPILFVYNRQTDLNLIRTLLSDVLPVAPAARRTALTEAALIPTAAAQAHPVFKLDALALANLRRLPPLAYNDTRWTASPDARVLATVAVRGVPLDDPMLVVRRRGRSRTAALLGADVWRWHNLPEDLEDLADVWPSLVENLVQWLDTREDNRPVRVESVANTYGGDDPVLFTGQVYDESLNPVPDASLEVVVTAPDGTRYPYAMEATGNGRYTLDVGTLPPGTYRYTATATQEGASLGEDTGSFVVGALTLEFRETQANPALMRQIAQRSGGRMYAPDELARLSTDLTRSAAFAPRIVEEERETPLWHVYLFLAAIVVLLTLEWFMRKRSGMV